MNAYLVAFGVSFIITILLTPLVRKLALRYNIVSQATVEKAHALDDRRIPYLGGLAIWAGFTIAALTLVPHSRELYALLAGATILAAVGAIDDFRRISPLVRLAFQVLAALVVLAGGIGIITLTNPFGGVIDLTWGRTAIDIAGLHFHITPIANLLTIIWLVGMVNTINFLDGLDGLATGVSSIAAIVVFALAISVGQPIVALIAIILAGSSLGFLPFNFYPAKIFMGDSGAYFLGLTLGLLAIYSGGKFATVGLVLGFTIIDALWAAVRRIRRGTSPFSADREHLHHLLMNAGLSQRLAVISLYILSAVFGAVALTSHSLTKLIALIILMASMGILIASLIRIGRKRSTTTKA